MAVEQTCALLLARACRKMTVAKRPVKTFCNAPQASPPNRNEESGMSITASPSLTKELKHFGLKDANKCYHCGTCTGICPLATDENPFPRRFQRYAQLGLKDKMATAPEPWLCYYCGECSDACPRGADPGETMMAMRRYQTAHYDWTGFAKKFYTSEAFEVAAVSIVAAIVMLLFILFANWDAKPDAAGGVGLNSFAPAWIIEILDLLMAAGLSAVLLSNVWRCVKAVMGDQLKVIPKEFYMKHLFSTGIAFVFQSKFSKCDDRTQWWVHLLIMTGYSSIFMMVVIFLRWFQSDHFINPNYPLIAYAMKIVGIYGTFAILYGTTYALVGRIKKSKAPYKHSHGTDWMFLILLQLTTLTGILIPAFIFLGYAKAVYITYAIHLAVAVPMLHPGSAVCQVGAPGLPPGGAAC